MSDKKSILKQKIQMKKLERTSKFSIERTKEKLLEKFEKYKKKIQPWRKKLKKK